MANVDKRKRNLSALHMAITRMADQCGEPVAEFKRAWLKARYGVESSTQLTDSQLWGALDAANGKTRYVPPAAGGATRERGADGRASGKRGWAERPASVAQLDKVRAVAAERYGPEWQAPLAGFIRRQTKGRTERMEDLTTREASGVIEAFRGTRVKSGLRLQEEAEK